MDFAKIFKSWVQECYKYLRKQNSSVLFYKIKKFEVAPVKKWHNGASFHF